jgi:sugar/nucleoside kinase (ribokinase family)
MTGCKVVVAGHICLDLTPKFPDSGAASLSDLLRPGSLVMVGECVVSTGGPVANTGLALVKLGVDCVLMGKVGEDAFGRAVVEKLSEYDAAEGIIRVPEEQTAYTIVIAPPGIDRAFLHNPGANDSFCRDDIDFPTVKTCDLFHLGYPPLLRRLYENGGEELAAIYRSAKARGATTSLDMALPDPGSPCGQVDWAAILRETLPAVDLFLPSVEEVLYCLDRDRFMRLRGEEGGVLARLDRGDYARLSDELLSWGVGAVVLKAGHHGVYARTAGRERLADFGRARASDPDSWADREVWQPAFPVDEVVSATGAGDCAIAGFLAAFLRGETVERAVRYAAAAGAQNVMAHDAISGLRSYEGLTKMVDDALGEQP